MSLHFEDVLRARLEALDPAPTLCASNLPYSVAGPFVIEALQRLPGIRRYCLMVQREVADRMAAPPGSKAYGTLSVWVGLYTRVVRARHLSRTIFHPQPHVDSTLIVLERQGPEELPDVDTALLREVVQAAFGQRRKTLVNALGAGLRLTREQTLEIVTGLGLSPDIRAERLAAGTVRPGGRSGLAEEVGVELYLAFVDLPELRLLAAKAETFPGGAPAAFERVESALPSLRGRKLYGVVYTTPGGVGVLRRRRARRRGRGRAAGPARAHRAGRPLR